MNCPNCGRPNDDSAKFCSGCGYKLEPQPPVSPVHVPPRIYIGKILFSILGILFLAVLIVVLVLVNKKPAPVDENTILADVSSSYYMTDLNAEPESIEIIDRKTSAKDGYDSIVAQVSSKNEYCGFLQTYDIFYRLYDNGWAVDSVMLNNTDYTLLQDEPDNAAVKADALSLLTGETSEYQLVNLDPSVQNTWAGEQTSGDAVAATSYDVTVYAENSSTTFTYSCTLDYQFYPQSGWDYYSGNISSRSYSPKTFPTTDEADAVLSSHYNGEITYNIYDVLFCC